MPDPEIDHLVASETKEIMTLGSYDIRKSPRFIMIARKISSAPADKEKRLYSDGRTTDALT